ncbi:hypothetical protein SLE2022_022960 [Rubroshorea leprosula]
MLVVKCSAVRNITWASRLSYECQSDCPSSELVAGIEAGVTLQSMNKNLSHLSPIRAVGAPSNVTSAVCDGYGRCRNVTVSNNCVVVFEDGFVKRRGAYDDEDFATQLKLRDRTVSLKLGEVVVEIRLKKWDVS